MNFLHKKSFRILGNKGFTLVELMVTIAIAAILATIAIPNMTQMMTRYRLSNENTSLMLDFVLARGEAANRSTRVTVCQSTNGTSCAADNWGTGRIVFVDRGAVGSIDAGDEILRVSSAIKDGDAMTSTANSTSLSYDASGTPSTNFTVTTCKAGFSGAQVIIYPTGRVRSNRVALCS